MMGYGGDSTSVRILEASNAIERMELMKALFDHLNQIDVEAELQKEPAVNCLGLSVTEPVITLKEQKLNKIRLVGMENAGWGKPGTTLRFQYEVHLENELSQKRMKNMTAVTKVIKEGKVMKFFGGRVVGVRWVGQALAKTLNRDQSIADDLMMCIKSWSHMEFRIEAVSPSDVYILGPRFTNPGTIAESYRSHNNEEIRCCIFGYTTLEKIAEHIQAGSPYSGQ